MLCQGTKPEDCHIAEKMRIATPEFTFFGVLNALYYKGLFSESDLRLSETLRTYPSLTLSREMCERDHRNSI